MSSHIWTIFLLILLVSDVYRVSVLNSRLNSVVGDSKRDEFSVPQTSRHARSYFPLFRGDVRSEQRHELECKAFLCHGFLYVTLILHKTHMFLRSVSKEIVPETTTRHLLQQRASEDGGASSHVDRHRWSDSEEASRSVRHGRGRAKDDLNNFRDVSKSSSGGMTSSSASVRHFNIEKSPSAWKLAFTNNNSSSALISSKQNSLDDFEGTLSSRRNWDSEKQSTFLDCDNCPIYDEMLLSQDSKLRVTRDQTDLQSSHGVPDSMSTMPLNSCILPVVRPLEDMVIARSSVGQVHRAAG
eukprot:757508-Hanusia_phi.AAC.1